MRNFLFLWICIACSTSLWSQDFCATQLNEDNVSSYIAYTNYLKSFPARDGQQTSYLVPVSIHSIGSSSEDYLSFYEMVNILCEVNDDFSTTGIRFFLSQEPLYHLNSQLSIIEPDNYLNALSSLTATYNISNTLNIYFTEIKNNTDGTVLCGAAPFPSWEDLFLNGRGGIIMNTNCKSAAGKTLTHELGHHFNLLHTFETSTGRELVTRQSGMANCEYAGDGFCDTPADTKNYSCPYANSGEKDPLGIIYEPDWSNFMSYYGSNCLSHFSTEQSAHMMAVLENDPKRNIYLQFPNVYSIPEATEILSPSAGSTMPVNEILAKWTPATEATWYSVVLKKLSGAILYSGITQETELVIQLANAFSNQQVLLEVSPINERYFCSNNVVNQRFSLGAPTSVYQDFIDGVSFKFVPNPVSNGKSVVARFNAGFYGNAQVEVVDLYGNILSSKPIYILKGENNLDIDTQSLTAGIYLVNLITEKGNIARKLVIE